MKKSAVSSSLISQMRYSDGTLSFLTFSFCVPARPWKPFRSSQVLSLELRVQD